MPGKYIYLEFLLVVRDYFFTLKCQEFCFEWLVPFVISWTLYFLALIDAPFNEKINGLNGYIVNLLGVLIGFSITCLTVLTTSGSSKLEALEDEESDRIIGRKKINLYRLMLITFTFGLLMEVFTLMVGLAYFLFDAIGLKDWIRNLFYAVNCFFLLNVLFLNVRNITNFYLIFTRNNARSKHPKI